MAGQATYFEGCLPYLTAAIIAWHSPSVLARGTWGIVPGKLGFCAVFHPLTSKEASPPSSLSLAGPPDPSNDRLPPPLPPVPSGRAEDLKFPRLPCSPGATQPCDERRGQSIAGRSGWRGELLSGSARRLAHREALCPSSCAWSSICVRAQKLLPFPSLPALPLPSAQTQQQQQQPRDASSAGLARLPRRFPGIPSPCPAAERYLLLPFTVTISTRRNGVPAQKERRRRIREGPGIHCKAPQPLVGEMLGGGGVMHRRG